MVAEQIRREEDASESQANTAGQDSDAGGLPDDEDDPDDPVEFEAWRLRELQRLQRDRGLRNAFEEQQKETERRRGEVA